MKYYGYCHMSYKLVQKSLGQVEVVYLYGLLYATDDADARSKAVRFFEEKHGMFPDRCNTMLVNKLSDIVSISGNNLVVEA